MVKPLATHDFADGGLDAAIAFFRRTRSELRTLRFVRVSTEWVRLFDVNGDYFELRGLGYPDADVVARAAVVRHAIRSGANPLADRRALQGIQNGPAVSLGGGSGDVRHDNRNHRQIPMRRPAIVTGSAR